MAFHQKSRNGAQPMRQRICLTLLFILFLAPCSFSQSDPFDLVVIGAHVVDGSDNPWYLADVGVRGGGRNRIKAGQSVDRFLLHFRLEAGPRAQFTAPLAQWLRWSPIG